MIARSTIIQIGRRSVIAGLGAAAATCMAGTCPSAARAAGIATPKGPVVLTISGKITARNSEGGVAFDMATLDALPQAGFTTGNPWGPTTEFTGVLFTTLLQRIGANGTKAIAYALNDYVVEIPFQPMSDDGPLLATRMNGQLMPVAHYGPLFVMYNFSKHHDWLQNSMYARCIWQLQRMVIA
jgi:hypothetical protein